jgi:hypothetical protein
MLILFATDSETSRKETKVRVWRPRKWQTNYSTKAEEEMNKNTNYPLQQVRAEIEHPLFFSLLTPVIANPSRKNIKKSSSTCHQHRINTPSSSSKIANALVLPPIKSKTSLDLSFHSTPIRLITTFTRPRGSSLSLLSTCPLCVPGFSR